MLLFVRSGFVFAQLLCACMRAYVPVCVCASAYMCACEGHSGACSGPLLNAGYEELAWPSDSAVSPVLITQLHCLAEPALLRALVQQALPIPHTAASQDPAQQGGTVRSLWPNAAGAVQCVSAVSKGPDLYLWGGRLCTANMGVILEGAVTTSQVSGTKSLCRSWQSRTSNCTCHIYLALT